MFVVLGVALLDVDLVDQGMDVFGNGVRTDLVIPMTYPLDRLDDGLDYGGYMDEELVSPFLQPFKY